MDEGISQYDAGWLHYFESDNHGDIRQANWDDLNIPARMVTLAVAGLPMLQRLNKGHIVATQSLAQDRTVFSENMGELGEKLRDFAHVQQVRETVWQNRHQFMFDHHADALIAFFRTVIEHCQRQGQR